MEVPLVDLKAQYEYLKPELDEALGRVFEHTQFILGREVEEFEERFSEYVGAEGAVGVASGTAALQLALHACGVKEGDHVITVSHTFAATGEAVVHCGAEPVFVDIDPQTYNLDTSALTEAITPRTKAIVPVHLYGHPADMDVINEVAAEHGLFVIEDAAQAHGAEYRGRRCGGLGHLACFSFYPAKNLGAYGDAGMVAGNDEGLLERVRRLRDHGRSSKYEHQEIGWGERLDTVQAALLLVKLSYLESWTEARRSAAAKYDEGLAEVGVVTPYVAPDVRHAYHLYVIRSDTRDALRQHLREKGVGAGVHYPIPLHEQPAFSEYVSEDPGLSVTKSASKEVLSLPIFPEITDDQIDHVVDTVREFYYRW